MLISSSTGKTVHGELPKDNKWRLLYAKNNPLDTDEGYHPQNIFRLVTRGRWHNFRQEAYFKINGDNLSDSPNRNSSNGLLLLNRYEDGNNLYYAGIRVDGTAVIKKKINGVYHIMDQRPTFTGSTTSATYDRASNPNLIPQNQWIGLRSEVTTIDGDVIIRLYIDGSTTGGWILVAEAVDDGESIGSVFDNQSHAGIRTDFMDVEMRGYKIEEII